MRRLRDTPAELITRTRSSWICATQSAVDAFFAAEKPDQVYLAAARVAAYLPTIPIRHNSQG